MCCVEADGSSVKIDETWSAVMLRVGAFSEGVVAPFQWLLVNDMQGVIAGKLDQCIVHSSDV